jgi:hypothetical protein
MPYLKHVFPLHRCLLPPVQEAGIGSIFLCSICGKEWEMYCPKTDLNYSGDERLWGVRPIYNSKTISDTTAISGE